MRDLNSIIIEGNLTRDPEFRETPKGTPVCMFSLASNRYYRTDEDTRQEVSFFNVETWSRVAESCNEYLKKGRGVRVVGRLKQDRWVNQEGQNCDRIKIVAEHVDFKPQFKKAQDRDAEGASGAMEGAEDHTANQTEEDTAAVESAASTLDTDEVAAAKVKKKDQDLLEAV